MPASMAANSTSPWAKGGKHRNTASRLSCWNMRTGFVWTGAWAKGCQEVVPRRSLELVQHARAGGLRGARLGVAQRHDPRLGIGQYSFEVLAWRCSRHRRSQHVQS